MNTPFVILAFAFRLGSKEKSVNNEDNVWNSRPCSVNNPYQHCRYLFGNHSACSSRIRNQSVIHPRRPPQHGERLSLNRHGTERSVLIATNHFSARLLYNTTHQGRTPQHEHSGGSRESTHLSVQYHPPRTDPSIWTQWWIQGEYSSVCTIPPTKDGPLNMNTVVDPGRVLICLYNTTHQGRTPQHEHSGGSRESTHLSVQYHPPRTDPSTWTQWWIQGEYSSVCTIPPTKDGPLNMNTVVDPGRVLICLYNTTHQGRTPQHEHSGGSRESTHLSVQYHPPRTDPSTWTQWWIQGEYSSVCTIPPPKDGPLNMNTVADPGRVLICLYNTTHQGRTPQHEHSGGSRESTHLSVQYHPPRTDPSTWTQWWIQGEYSSVCTIPPTKDGPLNMNTVVDPGRVLICLYNTTHQGRTPQHEHSGGSRESTHLSVQYHPPRTDPSTWTQWWIKGEYSSVCTIPPTKDGPLNMNTVVDPGRVLICLYNTTHQGRTPQHEHSGGSRESTHLSVQYHPPRTDPSTWTQWWIQGEYSSVCTIPATKDGPLNMNTVVDPGRVLICLYNTTHQGRTPQYKHSGGSRESTHLSVQYHPPRTDPSTWTQWWIQGEYSSVCTIPPTKDGPLNMNTVVDPGRVLICLYNTTHQGRTPQHEHSGGSRQSTHLSVQYHPPRTNPSTWTQWWIQGEYSSVCTIPAARNGTIIVPMVGPGGTSNGVGVDAGGT